MITDEVMAMISRRFKGCGLEINMEKSGIVYCKDGIIVREHVKTLALTFWASHFAPGDAYLRNTVFIRIFFLRSAGHP